MDQHKKYVVVTGAAGFVGSCMVAHLNAKGFEDIILVDDFSNPQKEPNLQHKKYSQKIHRNAFEEWLEKEGHTVAAIYHLGARTDTTLQDTKVFDELNVAYSKMIWAYCVQFQIPLVYASSAATYGDGAFGYEDDIALIPRLKPLNPYGISKNDFDIWVLGQPQQPPYWYGLKFFNVYGPNEYHKGRMASVVFHAYHQIKSKGSVKLFRSHHPDYADGGQLRDFVYVKDVVATCEWLMNSGAASSIYNLGAGKARTFNDLVAAIFNTLSLPVNIEYIDTPIDIRDTYQYYTQADMRKMQQAGLPITMHTLEEGVADYVRQFLATNTIW